MIKKDKMIKVINLSPQAFIAKHLSPQAFIAKHFIAKHLSPLAFIIILMFAAFQVQAQDGVPEWLQKAEQEVAEGTLSDDVMFDKFIQLIDHYSARDFDKSRLYFQKGIAFAREKKRVEWEAFYWGRMGFIYHSWEERDTAILYLEKALKLVENKEFYYHEANINGMTGMFYVDLSNYEKAMYHLLKSLELNEKDKTAKKADKQDFTSTLKTEVNIMNGIANIYYHQFNFDMYLEYLLRAKKVLDDNPTVDFGNRGSVIIRNIAQHYIKSKEAEKAFPYIEQGYQLSVNNDISGLMRVLILYSEYYKLREDHATQLRYAKEAMQIAEKMNILFQMNYAETILMGAYYDLKDYKTALYYGERLLLSLPEDDWQGLNILYSNLMMIYAFRGDQKNAEKYRAKHEELTKKMSDKNLQSTIKEMEVKYEVEQKDLDLERKQAVIERQTVIRNVIFIGLAGALLVVALLVVIVVQWKKRNRALVETNATKDKFFNIISHDLKNPAFAQRNAIRKLFENARIWDLDMITNHSGKLLKSANENVELLQTLLGWSQTQTGRIPYQPRMFCMVAKLKSSVGAIQNMANEKEVTLDIQMPASAVITGDDNMLDTVVRNLLVNAVKYTNKGGTVTLKVEPAAAKKHIVTVSDNGIGMTAEQKQNLFRLAIQPSHCGTAGEQGTGLGLIICKEFLKKHATELHVESEEGKGSKFWFEVKA